MRTWNHVLERQLQVRNVRLALPGEFCTAHTSCGPLKCRVVDGQLTPITEPDVIRSLCTLHEGVVPTCISTGGHNGVVASAILTLLQGLRAMSCCNLWIAWLLITCWWHAEN